MDNVVPQRAVNCFPNNKPWITRDICNTLNMKKQAFLRSDMESVKGSTEGIKTTHTGRKEGLNEQD
jgi:hypothetical protein